MTTIRTISHSISQDKLMWQYVASVAILLLASILRLWNLGSESAWIDEAYSIELASHSFADILKGTAADQHPPFYYLILRIWLMFGSGVTYARLLSVFIGVINVGQILRFSKHLAGGIIGLLGGLLLAVSPMHVWYSQEVRMYILLVSLTTATTAQLWWSLQSKKRYHWILFCIFSTLAIYTHYFAIFIFLAQGIWVTLWGWKNHQWRSLVNWFASMVITGLLFVPWLGVAMEQVRFHTMSWVTSPSIGDIRDTLLRLIFGIAVLSLSDLLRWFVLGLVLVLFIRSIQKFIGTANNEKTALFYIAAWGVIPFVAISITSIFYPVYQFKQYLIVVPPILVLAGWISFTMPRKFGVLSLIVLMISVSVSLTYQQVSLTKDDWRGTARYINQNSITGDVIFGNPAASSLALSLYSNLNPPFFGTPPNYDIISGGWEGEMLTFETANREISKLEDQYKRLWLVEFIPEFWDANGNLELWLTQNTVLEDDRYFGRIRVRLYHLTD